MPVCVRGSTDGCVLTGVCIRECVSAVCVPVPLPLLPSPPSSLLVSLASLYVRLSYYKEFVCGYETVSV